MNFNACSDTACKASPLSVVLNARGSAWPCSGLSQHEACSHSDAPRPGTFPRSSTRTPVPSAARTIRTSLRLSVVLRQTMQVRCGCRRTGLALGFAITGFFHHLGYFGRRFVLGQNLFSIDVAQMLPIQVGFAGRLGRPPNDGLLALLGGSLPLLQHDLALALLHLLLALGIGRAFFFV